MRRAGGIHSRLVAWAKILLPIAALAILSSVVFFARETETSREIPFLNDATEEMAGERIARPEYFAVTDSGASLRITAETAAPDGSTEGTFTFQNPTGRIETTSGRIIQAAAPSGSIAPDSDIAELSGLVSIDTSDGFHVISEGLTTRLDVTFARSGGAVRGDAPFGEIEAGALQLGDAEEPSDLLVFKEGVKLIYRPRN